MTSMGWVVHYSSNEARRQLISMSRQAVPADAIKEHLDKIMRIAPRRVSGKLVVGSFVSRTSSRIRDDYNGRLAPDRGYWIDDPCITDKIFTTEIMPLEKIGNYFTRSEEKLAMVYDLYDHDEIVKVYDDGKRAVPYSKVFNERYGICTEMAIMTQLFAQKIGQAYLISGIFKSKSGIGIERKRGLHRFNIIFEGKTALLLDAAKPIVLESGKSIPFVAPIEKIDGARIILPTEFEKEFGITREYRLLYTAGE